MKNEIQPSPNEGHGWFSWAARMARKDKPVVFSSNNQGVKLEKKDGPLWFLKISTEPVVEDPRIKK